MGWLKQKWSEILAVLIGAYCGFFVGLYQVMVSIVYPLPFTSFDRYNMKFPYTMLDNAVLHWLFDSFFFIHPGVAIIAVLVVQSLVRTEPTKNLNVPLGLGFGVGWIVLGWPLVFR